jgi:hypothetical protein
MVANLLALAAPGAGYAIVKTGATTFANVSTGGGAGVWYQDEVPGGVKNGSNKAFTLAHTPSSVLFLYVNGVYQVSGGSDYTLTGNSISMIVAPLLTDVFVATYS